MRKLPEVERQNPTSVELQSKDEISLLKLKLKWKSCELQHMLADVDIAEIVSVPLYKFSCTLNTSSSQVYPRSNLDWLTKESPLKDSCQ